MIKDIINGIARRLAEEFGDIKIYSEKVEQGFAKPCFAINCESIDNHLYRGRRYRTDNNIDILMFLILMDVQNYPLWN